MWSVNDGKELAVISGRGIGVRLCVFFADNVRVASAQEKAVLVSVPFWNDHCGVCQVARPSLDCHHSLFLFRIASDRKLSTT